MFFDKDFPQAHACFARYLDVLPVDTITLLYDPVLLAVVGEDRFALERFVRADDLSEEQCQRLLATIAPISAPLIEFTEKLMRFFREEGS